MPHGHQLGASNSVQSYLTPTELQLAIPATDLLSALDQLLQPPSAINEVGIVYVDSKAQEQDHTFSSWQAQDAFVTPEPDKLGIAAWCLRTLFNAAKRRFDQLHQTSVLPATPTTCGEDTGRRTTTMEEGKGGTKEEIKAAERMFTATKALLILHPYSYTAWGARKRVLQRQRQRQQQHTQCLVDELKFIDVVFSTHPKVGEAWAHRSWCVQQIWQQRHHHVATGATGATDTTTTATTATTTATTATTTATSLSILFNHEIDICELIAGRYPNNYYAWSHRQKVVMCMTEHDMMKEIVRTGR